MTTVRTLLPHRRPSAARLLRAAAAIVAAAGFAVDAYVHFDLAPTYDAIRTSTLSQGDLFRAEGVAAILAALAVLVRPRRYTAAFAFVVAASALAAVLVYRYRDLGSFGPIPSMYEPVWYAEKTQAAWAETAASAASAVLLVFSFVRRPAAAAHPVNG
jgi:hypothetical protein